MGTLEDINRVCGMKLNRLHSVNLENFYLIISMSCVFAIKVKKTMKVLIVSLYKMTAHAQ